MALSPLSTVVENYVTNIGYAITPDVAKAKLFLAAAMELQVRRPTSVTVDGQIVEFDYRAMAAQIQEARRWLAANDTTASQPSSGSRYYDHSDIRGY